MRNASVRVTLAIAFFAAGTAAASVIRTDRQSYELPLIPAGVVVIENPIGNISVTGVDDAKISVVADRVIRAADNEALSEASAAVQRVVEGNDRTRVIRTVLPQRFPPRWNAQVHYTVRMPRSAQLKVVSTQTQDGIRVTGINGRVMVKNMFGPVVVDNNGGFLTVENINGDTTLISPNGLTANVALNSVNGSIVVHSPVDAKFTWDVATVAGEARTPLDVRGDFVSPTRFRGSINGPSDVTVLTHTFAGNVYVLPTGRTASRGRSLREIATRNVRSSVPRVGPQLPAGNRGGVQLLLVPRAYEFETSIGDVRIDEIRGAARIVTGAGQVYLGTVVGHCDVTSHGGPLILGDVTGILNATTAGGNITIERAREGGTIETGGGTVQVQYAGGPVQLSSGGGDIVLRRAMSRVSAETRSGDIAITYGAEAKSERVAARTAKGNIVLTLPAGFAADVEAVVVTSEPGRDAIRSMFPGLSIQREQVEGKTRIRATGKINGGGQKIELQAQDGGIQLVADTQRVSPMVP